MPVNRRSFIARAGALLAAAVPLGLLEACAGSSAPAPPPTSAPTPTTAPAASPAAVAPSPAVAASPASPAAAASPLASPAASPAAAPSAASVVAGNLRKVSYGEVKALGDIPVYAAMEEGYFAEQGIQIDLNTFDSAANMVSPLGTGQLDTGGGPASAGLFNALARNIPIKIVADKGHSDDTPPGFPVSIFLVRKALMDSGQVKSAADLKGRKIGWVAKGIASEIDLAALLKTGGLTLSDVEQTLMGFPDMIPAMANGGIDAAGPPEPIATTMLKQGTAALLKYDYQVNPTNQVGAILYSNTFASSDLATRWLVA